MMPSAALKLLRAPSYLCWLRSVRPSAIQARASAFSIAVGSLRAALVHESDAAQTVTIPIFVRRRLEAVIDDHLGRRRSRFGCRCRSGGGRARGLRPGGRA